MLFEDEPTTPISDELMLTDADFPSTFVHFSHPDDYITMSNPIKPEYIFHRQRNSTHCRLILRISLKVEEGIYFPASFVCDTGAPKLYFCSRLIQLIQRSSVFGVDEDLAVPYVTFFGRKYRFEETPIPHAPANIIGLIALARFGLSVHEDLTFRFNSLPLNYLTNVIVEASPSDNTDQPRVDDVG
jgi:hypothetical protein